MDDTQAPRRPLQRASSPLYAQVADQLRAAIAGGSLAVGAELPKEAEIADRFGVSLITVRQALRDLASEGLIRKRSAKPAVVASRSPTLNLSWNFKNFADVADFTRDAELRVRSYRKEAAPELRRHFGLARGEVGYCLRSVLEAEKRKVAQVTTYFPPAIGARFRKEDFTEVLIFQSVQRRLGLRLDAAHVTVRAELADRALATDLGMDSGAAVLAIEMLYKTTEGEAIELSTARHPAELFSITYDLVNNLA
jgi:GntR family transcriptional regulator